MNMVFAVVTGAVWSPTQQINGITFRAGKHGGMAESSSSHFFTPSYVSRVILAQVEQLSEKSGSGSVRMLTRAGPFRRTSSRHV